MLRRTFLEMVAAGVYGSTPARIRALTRPPGVHWFGYYDKLQFDPTSRYALAMETDFEHRSPAAEDSITVGMIDTESGDRWTPLGKSRAWNWQQGCMLQWLPGSADEVIWNDRGPGGFRSVVLNVRTRRQRTLPAPVYAISPDAQWAVYPDFRRLADMRPGYGYAGIADPRRDDPAPRDAGIWRMDLRNGRTKLLLSFADALDIRDPHSEWRGAKHWFNHLLVAPDGRRFVFLHRWRGEKERAGFATRMITMNADGSDPYVLDPHGKTSHFIWRDPHHILAWAWHPSHGDAFYLYRDRSDAVEVVGKNVMTQNGHCTYLPGNRWILNDTYPDKQRRQHLYLYNVETAARVALGSFESPPQYTGEWRCDLHPRFSPNGRKITIDSPHNGGRQVYLVDIA